MKYFYGKPSGAWEHVADIFAAHDSVHSEKTSSLPLVQFWKPEGNALSTFAKELVKLCKLDDDMLCDAQFCFEYPVPVRKGRGKASMTDLMIITDKLAIAIEAKWTECKKNYERISTWLKSTKGKASSQANRQDVFKGWIEYINKYLKQKNKGSRIDGNCIKGIPYQMLHRIASACHVATSLLAKDKTAEAIVIYQLFYNDETKTRMEKFATKLLENYKAIFGDEDSVRFHVIMTEVKICDDFEIIKEQCKTDQGKYDWNELFRLMQTNCIYKFPLKTIKSVSVSD
jgi:hypothetical protein